MDKPLYRVAVGYIDADDEDLAPLVRGLRDEGHEVVPLGGYDDPDIGQQDAVRAAIQEDADVLDCWVGGGSYEQVRRYLTARLDALDARDITVVLERDDRNYPREQAWLGVDGVGEKNARILADTPLDPDMFEDPVDIDDPVYETLEDTMIDAYDSEQVGRSQAKQIWSRNRPRDNTPGHPNGL